MGNAALFAVRLVPGIDVGKIAYFAASVVWRASAHRWNLQDHRLCDIDLGRRYREGFRQYLLGEAAFPKDAAVLVDVFGFRSPLTLATMLFPYGGRRENLHHYRFTIPGVAFNLYLGQMMPSQLRDACILRPTGILFSSKRDDHIVRDFATLMEKARVSLSLA
jgi:hypothetical protein